MRKTALYKSRSTCSNLRDDRSVADHCAIFDIIDTRSRATSSARASASRQAKVSSSWIGDTMEDYCWRPEVLAIVITIEGSRDSAVFSFWNSPINIYFWIALGGIQRARPGIEGCTLSLPIGLAKEFSSSRYELINPWVDKGLWKISSSMAFRLAVQIAHRVTVNLVNCAWGRDSIRLNEPLVLVENSGYGPGQQAKIHFFFVENLPFVLYYEACSSMGLFGNPPLILSDPSLIKNNP
jgi:hypothetical protein